MPATRITRRKVLGLAVLAGLRPVRALPAAAEGWSLPIAFPGEIAGDGLFIRHGFACENATYYPGLSHTGENWYGIDRNASEADVLAVATGEVRYADFDYPGRVVIIEHHGGLFSMYGHLAYDLAVETGQNVIRGDVLGRVLARSDDFARSHLHFEVRTFFTSDLINGDSPSHGFTCGYRCPPGPGYWPLDAEHPAELGWLNPTHAIARRMFPKGARGSGALVRVNLVPSAKSTAIWSEPPWRDDARVVGELELVPGDTYPLLQIAAGTDDSGGRSAKAYRLWYRIRLGDGERGWVQAAVPSAIERDLDGAPASVLIDFLPIA